MKAVSLLLVFLLLAGCGGGSSDAGKPLEQVRVGYFANVTHAQAVLGAASGDFAAAVAPAKLSTKVFNAGPSLIEALFAGEIDIGYGGPGPALSAHQKSRGRGIRVIAGAAANGVSIVASPRSGISTLADLAGKRIGTPQHGNTQDIAARHYLLTVLKQADAKNVIPVANAEQAALMERGDIDAAWVPEPWGSRLIAENGAKLIAEEKDLWPEKQFALTVVVTTPEFLRKHPDVVKQILGVHEAWTQRLQQDPQSHSEQLGEALVALTGKRLPPGVLQDSLKRVQFTLDPLPETFATMTERAIVLGFAPPTSRSDGLITTVESTP